MLTMSTNLAACSAITFAVTTDITIPCSLGRLYWSIAILCKILIIGTLNGSAHFEKCKQLLEYHNLLLLNDIWWLKF